MKKTRHIFIGMLGAILILATVALAQTGEWKKLGESNGIVGWSRPNSLSSVEELKTEATINAPVAVVEAILRDTPALKKFMFMCSEARNIDVPSHKNTKDAYVTYFRQGMPWPVSDRYGLGKIEFFVDKTTGVITVIGSSAKDTFNPGDKKAIRMPVGEGKWIITPTGEKTCKLYYQLLADPGGSLPGPIVNMLMKNIGMTTLKNIRKLSQQEPYKSVKAVVTTTPLSIN